MVRDKKLETRYHKFIIILLLHAAVSLSAHTIAASVIFYTSILHLKCPANSTGIIGSSIYKGGTSDAYHQYFLYHIS